MIRDPNNPLSELDIRVPPLCWDKYNRLHGGHNPNFLHESIERDGRRFCIHCGEDIADMYNHYIYTPQIKDVTQ
jgi:hypothetical protein